MRRRALVAVVLAMIAAGTASVPLAGAEGAPATGHTQFELDWVAAHYGLSTADALRRLDIEDAAGRLSSRIEGRWTDSYGGMWLNVEGSETTVTVAFTTDVDARVAELRREFEFPDVLRGAQVERPIAELLESMRRLVDERTALQRGVEPPGIDPAISATGGNLASAVIPSLGRLVVVAATASNELEQALRARYSETVELRQSEISPPMACTRDDCRYTMRGGLHFGPDGCTSAFPVVDSINRRMVLSAAHCGNLNFSANNPDIGGARVNGTSVYGYVENENYIGPVDVERILRTNNTWTESNGIFVDGQPFRQIAGFKLHAEMVQGMTVAYSGRTSGTHAGPIVTNSFSPPFVPYGFWFVATNACGVQGGDSGAPFFREYFAMGILHGSGYGVGCTSYGSIDFALESHGVTLVTQ